MIKSKFIRGDMWFWIEVNYFEGEELRMGACDIDITTRDIIVNTIILAPFAKNFGTLPFQNQKGERERKKERERGINSISTSMTVMPCGCPKGTFRTKHLFIVGPIAAVSR